MRNSSVIVVAVSSAVVAAIVVTKGGVVIACVVSKFVDFSDDVSSEDVVPRFDDMANDVVIICPSLVVVPDSVDGDVDHVEASG